MRPKSKLDPKFLCDPTPPKFQRDGSAPNRDPAMTLVAKGARVPKYFTGPEVPVAPCSSRRLHRRLTSSKMRSAIRYRPPATILKGREIECRLYWTVDWAISIDKIIK